MPVTVGVAVGFCNEDVNPAGPLQLHAVAFVELAESVTVPVAHIGPLLVAPVEAGTVFTVAVTVAIEPHPLV